MKNIKDIMIEFNQAELKNIDDTVGITLNDSYGLFIQVEETEEGLYYFIEYNFIDSTDGWNPLDTTSIFVNADDIKEDIEHFIMWCNMTYTT